MKFGKTYLETLQGIPAEWRAQAIEYRKLKKVINRVASELEELGLTSEVLKDLLAEREPVVGEASGDSSRARRGSSTSPTRTRSNTIRELNAEAGDDVKEEADVKVEAVVSEPYDSSEDDGPEEDGLSARQRSKRRKASKRRAKASYELAGTTDNPEPRIRIVFSSASSGSDSYSDSTDSSFQPGLLSSRGNRNRYRSPSTGSGSDSSPRFQELADSSEDEKQDGPSGESSEVASADDRDEIEGDFEGAGPQANKLLKKMYGVGAHSDDEDEDHEQDWASVGVHVEPRAAGRRKSDETLRWEGLSNKEQVEEATQAEKKRVKEEKAANGDEDADDEGEKVPRRRRHHHRQHRKEVFIPLSTDNEFLSLLANALASLAALQVAQKLQFTQAVELLAREVSNVSSPSRPKSDLYIWREIFSLWIEAEIFESERERDRGERTTEEVEKKLDWFVDRVAKRKLAKRMKNKESRAALEKFIQLNVQLLEMKKFQLANEEAARKILKKHDKRTALTASLGFPKFIASSSDLFTEGEGTNNGVVSRKLGLPGFPSLPHILLSTFTTTLLPIIPQLEDYECAICGDVAFKPIRLECGHKFCVRCLVKMQKRGQDNCPQCRSPVVLRANASNLDTAMQSYLQLWFPKEVKEKQALNKKETAKEELEEMGLADHRCLVQ